MKILIINLLICYVLTMSGCLKNEVIQKEPPIISSVEEKVDIMNKEVSDFIDNIKINLPIKDLMVECVYQDGEYEDITFFIGNSNMLYDNNIQTKIDNIILSSNKNFNHIKVLYKNGRQGLIIEKYIK